MFENSAVSGDIKLTKEEKQFCKLLRYCDKIDRLEKRGE
jgi:hypothetical protein